MPKRNLETLEMEGGNTSTPSISNKRSKKRVVPSCRWIFTWNNYPDIAVETLETIFKFFDIEYIFGKEVAPETGTPHLQGYIEAPIKIRPVEKLQLPKQISWRKAKGKRGHNIPYCSKDGQAYYSQALKPRRQLQLIEPDRDWQKKVIEIVDSPPNDRDIYWFWEGKGGVGKTCLCKWLVKKRGAIVLGGKAADIRNGILQYVEKYGYTPELVVINITRSQEKYVSYEGLENIKDMLFYSGKYEGGMVCDAAPHLIVFANFSPNFYQLSEDRWKIEEIV